MTNTDPAREIAAPLDAEDEAHFEAMADWAQGPAAAEAFTAAATTTTRAQREELQEQMRATLAASLPTDPAHDSPVEAFTRAELAKTGRGRGRPSLAGTTGTGTSRARQVRLSSDLDERLSAYTKRADVRASDVMRQAIASYLDRG